MLNPYWNIVGQFVDRLAPCPGDSKAKLQMQASTSVQVELAARE